ncbi:MAG: hypothetical protein U0R52_12620 [Solirubrobacterales bacterium]
MARTLVKSEPEVVELISAEPRLNSEDVEVTLAEKGFGTRVAIAAGPRSGFDREALERMLDDLAEPRKRPFSNA